MDKESIPYFEDSVDAMIPDQPIIERETVSCIVYDPLKDEILCLQWNDFNWKTLINGGIESGEDIISAAKREISEETGYKDLEFIGELGKTRSGFYNARAKENRINNATGLVFELVSPEKDTIDESEMKKHIHVWIPKSEILSFINVDWQLYLLGKALGAGILNKKII